MIYEPSDDSYLLEEQIKKNVKGKSFLDLGSGSGIQALSALNSGAINVLSADINPESVKLLKSKNLNAIQSDLFSKIKGKFDVIAFNPPYLPEDPREDNESKIITTGGLEGDEIIIKFLNQAKPHLEKNGIILLLVSSLTPKNKIKNKLLELNFKYKILSKKKLFMESLEIWKIQQGQ